MKTLNVPIILSYLRMKVCFSHLILNDCCICMRSYVFVCVNFEDEILLRGEECKTRVNLNFSKEGQNGKLPLLYELQT